MEIPQSLRRAVEVILVCIIAFLAVYIFSIVWNLNRAPEEKLAPVDPLTAQKMVVMDRLEDSSERPLTQGELVDIINFVSDGEATFTEAEREAITKKLRAQ